MPSDIIDKKRVLLDSRIKGKRIVGLRTYYKELESERRVTLINLFIKDNQVAVNQIVNILLGLTLTTDAVKVPREFDLDQHMNVYDKTYEAWVYELTALMQACQDCGKPTWELAGNIIASLPLDRVYSKIFAPVRTTCSSTAATIPHIFPYTSQLLIQMHHLKSKDRSSPTM